VSRRRPFAVAVWKDGRRAWYGFTTRAEALAFHDREIRAGHRVSPIITLGARRGRAAA